jgi:hypothetical protein
MSRSGCSDDFDGEYWAHIRWRGQVASAIRGKRGQAFLKELVQALDALPDKKLIAHDLERDGNVCAIGSVGKARNVDMSGLDPEDPDGIANVFGIASQLVREIEYMNDECVWSDNPAERWSVMRKWAADRIVKDDVSQTGGAA